jgi:hypothetical protein
MPENRIIIVVVASEATEAGFKDVIKHCNQHSLVRDAHEWEDDEDTPDTDDLDVCEVCLEDEEHCLCDNGPHLSTGN